MFLFYVDLTLSDIVERVTLFLSGLIKTNKKVNFHFVCFCLFIVFITKTYPIHSQAFVRYRLCINEKGGTSSSRKG